MLQMNCNEIYIFFRNSNSENGLSWRAHLPLQSGADAHSGSGDQGGIQYPEVMPRAAEKCPGQVSGRLKGRREGEGKTRFKVLNISFGLCNLYFYPMKRVSCKVRKDHSKTISKFIKKLMFLLAHLSWKFKISSTTEPISPKLGTKHPWVKGIQVCSNLFHGDIRTKCIDEINKSRI